MDTATPPGKDDTLKQARFQGRDGWLFLGLAHVALLAALVVGRFPYSWDSLSDLSAERLTGLGVALTAWLVLAAVGFWKLHAARRMGWCGLAATRGRWLFWFYVLVLCGSTVEAVFPHANWRHRAAVLPAFAVAGGVLLWRLFTKTRPKLGHAREGLLIVALGQLLMGCAWLWPRLRPYGWSPPWDDFVKIWRWMQAGSGRPSYREYPVPPRDVLLWITPWVVLTVWGTYKVLFAPPEKKRSWPARLGVFLLSVYALAVFLFLINLCLWEELCTRFAVLAGLAGVVLGVALGWWLAGLRQKSRPGWRRRAAFAVPLAILCLSIAAPFAGLVGSALTPWTWETRERTEWPARLPSWVRWAPANVVVWALPGRMEAILIKNLAPPALAREQAYRPSQPNLGGSAWVCWARQDPHAALAAALAVGPTDTPALPVTPWDYEAGYVLGAYGDERDVLERLNGPFSDQLANGLGYGLCKKHRTGMGVAVAARFERSASPVPCFGLLRYLFQCDRGRLKGMMMGYVKDPRPLSIARLDAASCYLLDLDKDHQLRVYMLGSANLDVRKIALKVSMWDAEADLRWIRPVLQAAEGRLPNSDADEQRLAAECLQWMLGRKFERPFVSKIQAGAPVLPLKPDERSDLQKLCALAREKLGLPPAKPPADDSPEEPEPQGKTAPTPIEQ